METKWIAIAVAVIFAAGFISIAIADYSENQVSSAKAQAGLEECPRIGSQFRTIWVKDCVAYLETEVKDDI